MALRFTGKFFALSVAVFFALSLFPSVFSSAEAAEKAEPAAKQVRIGYFYNGDFMHKNSNGSFEGYDVEYYYTIAGYANWDISFVEFDNLNDAQDAMRSGDIDVMSGLSITPERTDSFIVSAQKMCTSFISLQVRSSEDKFSVSDPSTLNDMTCGVLAGSIVKTSYENWCHEHGLTPHAVEFENIVSRNAALADGVINSIAAGSTVPGAQRIATLSATDLYFMFNRSRGDLKSELDSAMNILSIQNPSFATNTSEKYFPLSKNTQPSFSLREKAYIRELSEIRVAVLKYDEPFSNVNKDGSVSGIIPEYLNHISSVIGKNIVCVPYNSKADACAALAAGNVDAVGKFSNDIYEAQQNKSILTMPYIRMNMVQLSLAGTSDIRTVAVPECNAAYVSAAIGDSKSDIKFNIFANADACLDALHAKKADSIICSQPAASWLLNQNRASEYTIAPFGSSSWDISCAVAQGENGNLLRSVFNKVFMIDNGYINKLIISDTINSSLSLSGFFTRIPIWVQMIIFIVLFVIVLLLVISLFLFKKRQKESFKIEKQLAENEKQKIELNAMEKSVEEKNAFFSNISHDMRTPLNAIIGFADLSEKEESLPLLHNYNAKIKSSGLLLLALINDTLTISKAGSGKLSLHLTSVNMREVFISVIETINDAAEKKNIAFMADLSDIPDRYVLADALNVQKIVLNLLSNAVKYTPNGGHVFLRVSDIPQENGDPDSLIVIADDGIGISPEFLPHIFEPFSQEKRHGYESVGTGLGLSIVKQLTDLMGGSVNVKSEKNKGTTFSVRLHFIPVASAENTVTAEKEISLPQLEGKKVLLCEDNELNREIAVAMLREKNIIPMIAEDGEIGCNLFSASTEGEISAILMDLRMPVTDGYTAAKKIRAMKRADAKSIPIIALTADAFEEDIQRCTECGMNAHIAKPISPDKLYKTLAKEIGRCTK